MAATPMGSGAFGGRTESYPEFGRTTRKKTLSTYNASVVPHFATNTVQAAFRWRRPQVDFFFPAIIEITNRNWVGREPPAEPLRTAMIVKESSEKRVEVAPRKPKPEHAICHPERSAYARSLCRPCYDRARWSGQVQSSASTESRAVIEDVASQVPRAVRKIPTESQYIRTANPKVAEHVAAVMVKNNLDAERAAAELKPDLSPLGVAQTATKLENDPRVQRAVQKELQKRGLDKDSRDHFVDLLWRYAESEEPADEKRQLQAMRILGKAFISESVEVSQPAVLRLRGFDEEIRQMFDGRDPRENLPNLDS